MILYDAIFDDGINLFTVGPFDSSTKAADYGKNHHNNVLDFLGFARRNDHAELVRILGSSEATENRNGIITRWRNNETYGFIVDRQEQTWFVSRRDLPEKLSTLTRGTLVNFTGSLTISTDKKYPTAYLTEAQEEEET